MSQYVILQWSCSSTKLDERVNVGVVAFDDSDLQCAFLTDLSRAASFMEVDEAVMRGLLDDYKGMTREFLHRLCNPSYPVTVTGTEPRGAIWDVSKLLDFTAKHALTGAYETFTPCPTT